MTTRQIKQYSSQHNSPACVSREGMEQESMVVYEIRIHGLLDQTWSDWFSPLRIVNEPNGESTLTGVVRDQAELRSLIDKVFNLNLTLLAVNCLRNPST